MLAAADQNADHLSSGTRPGEVVSDFLDRRPAAEALEQLAHRLRGIASARAARVFGIFDLPPEKMLSGRGVRFFSAETSENGSLAPALDADARRAPASSRRAVPRPAPA